MDLFWENSWKTADQRRMEDYLATFPMEADDWIRLLHRHSVRSVCDAGCGCGVYTVKLARHGFTVSGFDVSDRAVAIARSLLEQSSLSGELKTASVLDTGYSDSQFDCVISRDVLDHMPMVQARAALRELCRITKAGGLILFTLDAPDAEYRTEPHRITAHGDLVYTQGKWKGMVFHPYTEDTISEILPTGLRREIREEDGAFTVILQKFPDNGR